MWNMFGCLFMASVGYLLVASSNQFELVVKRTQTEEEILKTQLVKQISTKSLRRIHRAATARLERLWDYGVIPYEIESNFSGRFLLLSHRSLGPSCCQTLLVS